MRFLNLRQGGTDRALQRQRPGRRLHAAAHAHQQRVAEQLAQAVERVAHRRLAEGQALGGTGDIALAQQGVEHTQQVEIERGDIHRGNTTYHKTKFQK